VDHAGGQQEKNQFIINIKLCIITSSLQLHLHPYKTHLTDIKTA